MDKSEKDTLARPADATTSGADDLLRQLRERFEGDDQVEDIFESDQTQPGDDAEDAQDEELTRRIMEMFSSAKKTDAAPAADESAARDADDGQEPAEQGNETAAAEDVAPDEPEELSARTDATDVQPGDDAAPDADEPSAEDEPVQTADEDFEDEVSDTALPDYDDALEETEDTEQPVDAVDEAEPEAEPPQEDADTPDQEQENEQERSRTARATRAADSRRCCRTGSRGRTDRAGGGRRRK